MAGWLQKKPSLPARPAQGRAVAGRRPRPPSAPQGLPNATVIYGIGASLMFVAALFLLLHGRWFPAVVTAAVGACLVGFALHLLKHQD